MLVHQRVLEETSPKKVWLCADAFLFGFRLHFCLGCQGFRFPRWPWWPMILGRSIMDNKHPRETMGLVVIFHRKKGPYNGRVFHIRVMGSMHRTPYYIMIIPNTQKENDGLLYGDFFKKKDVKAAITCKNMQHKATKKKRSLGFATSPKGRS